MKTEQSVYAIIIYFKPVFRIFVWKFNKLIIRNILFVFILLTSQIRTTTDTRQNLSLTYSRTVYLNHFYSSDVMVSELHFTSRYCSVFNFYPVLTAVLCALYTESFPLAINFIYVRFEVII